MKLNYHNCKKHKKEFERYEGVLPFILHYTYNINNHLTYLKEYDKELYKIVADDYIKHRIRLKGKSKRIESEDWIELKKWITKNPQYNDIIVEE